MANVSNEEAVILLAKRWLNDRSTVSCNILSTVSCNILSDMSDPLNNEHGVVWGNEQELKIK